MRETENRGAKVTRLIDALKQEMPAYRDLELPGDLNGRRRILRGLMNVRPPMPLREEVLALQDEYLAERAEERGIVTLEEIPVLGKPGEGRISLWRGDITRLACDAIVNAANSRMLGCFIPCHSCIDNCIHTYAGMQLRAECAAKMAEWGEDYEQPTALPLLTDAYNLPARKVIHIAGPIVTGSLTWELEEDLASCYRNALDLCEAEGLRSIAFCCISTGVYRFPASRAAEIAVETVTAWLAERPETVERVIFNVFSERDQKIYEEVLGQ